MRMTIVALILLGGCSPFCLPPAAPDTTASEAPGKYTPLPLIVSVKDVMGGAIAFSAHVSEQVDAADAPLTPGDWHTARAAASDMMAFATLLTTPNNNSADNARQQDADWRPLAKAMQDAGGNIAAAAEARDRQALKSAVSSMRAACQACHAHYGVHGQ